MVDSGSPCGYSYSRLCNIEVRAAATTAAELLEYKELKDL